MPCQGIRYDHMYSHETRPVSRDLQYPRKIQHTHHNRQIEAIWKIFHGPRIQIHEDSINNERPSIRVIEHVPAQMSILRSKSAHPNPRIRTGNTNRIQKPNRRIQVVIIKNIPRRLIAT